MDLSISITHWNTPDLLVRCLKSFMKYSNGIEYDLTIVDNASTEGDIRQIADRFSQFRWIFNQQNKGGGAVDDALSSFQGRYVLLLGPDTQVQPDCLQEMIRFLDSHPEAGAVSALLLNPDGSLQRYYRRLPNPWMLFFCRTRLGRWIDDHLLNSRFLDRYTYEDLKLNSVAEVEQPAGPCFMIRSHLVRDETGYVNDPELPFYFQDVDMCKRVYDAGYRIYVLPQAKVIHQHGASFSRRSQGWKRAEYYASLLHYLCKYHRLWAIVFRIYLISEMVALMINHYLRLPLSGNPSGHKKRIRELRQILSQIASFSLSCS